MEFKKFRSPKDSIRLSDLSGHTVYITSELTDVPDILWGQAYASGAISEDMNVGSMSSYLEDKKKELEEEKLKERQEIKEALIGIYKQPIGYVDKDNKPLTRKVLGVIKKPVKKEIIDSIWEEIVLEQEGE